MSTSLNNHRQHEFGAWLLITGVTRYSTSGTFFKEMASKNSPDSSIIRIFLSNDYAVGTGFLVDDRHALTCAHVVLSALGLRRYPENIPTDEIILDFPLIAPGKKLTAHVVDWKLPTVTQGDIAILEISSPLPLNTTPAPLISDTNLWHHDFRAFGFPQRHDNGTWATGRILGQVASGHLQIEDTKQIGYFIQPGFSGGAVWDEELNGVVGMIVMADLEVRTAFMLPIANFLNGLYPPEEKPLPDLRIARLGQRKQTLDSLTSLLPQFSVTSKLLTPSSTPEMREHIYISGDQAQGTLLMNLKHDLEKTGHRVQGNFNILEEEQVGIQAIIDGIYYASAIIFAISPESSNSKRVAFELQSATGYDKRVIPILLRPTLYVHEMLAKLNFYEGNVANFTENYRDGIRALRERDLLPVPAKIREFCRKISAELEEKAKRADWHMTHFIPEQSRLLIVHARPYQPSSLRGKPENLVERLHHTQRAIVLGEPGAGKTVALERFAWELANKLNPEIPLVIKLGEVRKTTLAQKIKGKIAATRSLELETVEEVDWFLNSNKGYILLDGLNEVPTEYRCQLVDEINELEQLFPSFRLVVSSRIQDESWRNLHDTKNFDTLVIQPMLTEDIQKYLQLDLGTENAKLLWKSLDTKFQELLRTPLILKLVKGSWLAREQEDSLIMPNSRGALYDNFVRTRFHIDNVSEPLRRHRMLALEKLAIFMQRESILRISEEKIFELLGDDALITALHANGFLVGEGDDIKFIHQTFQEFFAARAIRADYATYLKNIGQGEWAEVFIQLAGLLDSPDTLIHAIEEKNVWLAWWCVLEGNDVHFETRKRVEDRSIGLVRSSIVSDRRKAAEVLAAQGLERVIEPLITLVKDEDEEVSSIALEGLGKLKIGVAPVLTAEFMEVGANLHQRVKLGQALGITGDPRPGVIFPVYGKPSIDWVSIPEGSFPLPNGQRHLVKSFLISRYLITNSHYEAFIQAPDGYRSLNWWPQAGKKYQRDSREIPKSFRNSDFSLPNHPAIFVSWYEAVAFCSWFSEKLGYEVRLPTEAEWIRASHGEKLPPSLIEHSANFQNANTYETSLFKTTAVGVFSSGTSPYGVFDILGNVFCWSITKWRENLDEPENNELEGEYPRVMLGGSFTHTTDLIRMGDFPFGTHFFTGFRLVRPGGINRVVPE